MRETQRQRGKDEVGQRAVAAQREPAPEIGEEIEQREAEHELRRGDAEEGERHRRLVAEAAAPRCGIDAGGNADHQLRDDGAEHEEQGGRKPRRDKLAHVGFPRIGDAKIAPHEAAEVINVLHGDRLVEAELLADLLAHLRGGVAARDHGHGIGRDHEGEAEGDDAHPPQDEQRRGQALGEIGQHQPLPRWVGSSASRSPSPTRLKASARMRMAAPGMKTSHGALRK